MLGSSWAEILIRVCRPLFISISQSFRDNDTLIRADVRFTAGMTF